MRTSSVNMDQCTNLPVLRHKFPHSVSARRKVVWHNDTLRPCHLYTEFNSFAFVSTTWAELHRYNYTCSERNCTFADVRELIMVHPIFKADLNGKIQNNGVLS